MAEYVNKFCGINHKDAETDADRGRDGMSGGVTPHILTVADDCVCAEWSMPIG
jgi:hypothetical protein